MRNNQHCNKQNAQLSFINNEHLGEEQNYFLNFGNNHTVLFIHAFFFKKKSENSLYFLTTLFILIQYMSWEISCVHPCIIHWLFQENIVAAAYTREKWATACENKPSVLMSSIYQAQNKHVHSNFFFEKHNLDTCTIKWLNIYPSGFTV